MSDRLEKLLKFMIPFFIVVFSFCMVILVYCVLTSDAPVIVKVFFSAIFLCLDVMVTIMFYCYLKEIREIEG